MGILQHTSFATLAGALLLAAVFESRGFSDDMRSLKDPIGNLGNATNSHESLPWNGAVRTTLISDHIIPRVTN